MSSKKKAANARAAGDVAFVPRLRFPEFRGAEGWTEKRLGDEGEFLSSLTGKAGGDFDVGEARFVTYMNVFSNTFVDPKALRFVDVKSDEYQNAVSRGDVFFTISSETPEEVGMSSVLLDELENLLPEFLLCAIQVFSNQPPRSDLYRLLASSAAGEELLHTEGAGFDAIQSVEGRF